MNPENIKQKLQDSCIPINGGEDKQCRFVMTEMPKRAKRSATDEENNQSKPTFSNLLITNYENMGKIESLDVSLFNLEEIKTNFSFFSFVPNHQIVVIQLFQTLAVCEN